MATTDDPRTSSALDAVLDVFRVRQYFNAWSGPAACQRRCVRTPPAVDAGTGFYAQFLDSRERPESMRAGRRATLAALRQAACEGSQR